MEMQDAIDIALCGSLRELHLFQRSVRAEHCVLKFRYTNKQEEEDYRLLRLREVEQKREFTYQQDK
jgi:hypothetical protein